MLGLDTTLFSTNESAMTPARNAGHFHALMNEDSIGVCALLGGDQIKLKQIQTPEMHFKLTRTTGDGKHGRQQTPMGIGHAAPRDWHWLMSSMDTLGLGLEIWDEHDRLLAFNSKINAFQPGLRSEEQIGECYENVTRMNLARRLLICENGKEQEWLDKRLPNRGWHTEPLLDELDGDHWVNTYETKTPEGLLMVVWVDVTGLVRKSRVLEAINRELAYQSATDGLTGLANRRRFDQALVSEQILDKHHLAPMSLLMLDIDHFKKYNDFYGHLAGDQCLRRIANLLSMCTRRTADLVARYGGEEFVIFLPGSDLLCAQEIAQQCLDLLAETAIAHAASPTSHFVTFSIGIACLVPKSPLNADHLLNAADRALYRAKACGRACFKLAMDEDWSMANEGLSICAAPQALAM